MLKNKKKLHKIIYFSIFFEGLIEGPSYFALSDYDVIS